ncbi:MAG: hypothetical protein ABI772_01890 [Bacteroidota bacterium]
MCNDRKPTIKMLMKRRMYKLLYLFLIQVLFLQFCWKETNAQSCGVIRRDLCNISIEEKQKFIKEEVVSSDLIVAYYLVSADTFYYPEKEFYYLIYTCKVLQILGPDNSKQNFDTFNIVLSGENIGKNFPFDRNKHVQGIENIAFLNVCHYSLPERFGKRCFQWKTNNGVNRIFAERKEAGYLLKAENGICIKSLDELNQLLKSSGVDVLNYSVDFYIDHNVDYEKLYKEGKK